MEAIKLIQAQQDLLVGKQSPASAKGSPDSGGDDISKSRTRAVNAMARDQLLGPLLALDPTLVSRSV